MSDGAKAAVGIGSLILGFILFMIPVVGGVNLSLAIGVNAIVAMLIFGVIFLGVIPAIMFSGGSHHGVSSRSAYYANRAGSYRAKRNIYRGHRYSK
jgi:hypothetical protein